MKKINIYLIIFYLLLFNPLFCILIDNRYLPLYRPVYERYECKKSVFGSNIFFLLSREGKSALEEDTDLPNIEGKYNLSNVSKALQSIGEPNPLPDQWQSLSNLTWTTRGKLEAQGLWIGLEKAWKNVSFGLSQYFLHVTNTQRFLLKDIVKELRTPLGGEIEAQQALIKANNLLGFKQIQFNKGGVSDLDLYLRFGTVKEYVHKFRKFDASVTFGMLVPTGVKRDINIPTSIPFGGNGHFGLYAKGDLFLELKDDVVCGFWLDFVNRLPKTQTIRVPVADEPLNYGASIQQVKIDPGITIGFNPYVALTDIQEGVGFRAGYTLVYHDEDAICDRNSILKTDLQPVSEASKWMHEFLNLGLTYDFSKATVRRRFEPRLYLYWDIPFGPFGAKNAPKINRVSVGFEFNF